MNFGVQELAGLIRGQLHDRVFDLWDVKIVSTEFGPPGILRVTAKIYEAGAPHPRPFRIMLFEVKIEKMF